LELKYSVSKVPYINLGNGMLIFSKTTEHKEKGFKFLVFKGNQVSSVCTSGAKAKRKKYTKMYEDIGFTLDMNLKRRSSGKVSGIPHNARFSLSKITEKILRKILNELVVGEYFPRNRLQKLDEMLQLYYSDETDTWDDDPTATESYDDVNEIEDKKPKKKLTLSKKPKRKLTLAKPKSIIKKRKKK